MREKSSHLETSSSEERGTDIIQAIQRALKDLKYGSVEIVVQDSKIVQIERKEKFRFGKRTQ